MKLNAEAYKLSNLHCTLNSKNCIYRRIRHVIKRSFLIIVIIVDNMTQYPSTTFHRRPTYKGKLLSYMLDCLNWLHEFIITNIYLKKSSNYVATVLYLRPSEFVQTWSYRVTDIIQPLTILWHHNIDLLLHIGQKFHKKFAIVSRTKLTLHYPATFVRCTVQAYFKIS